MACRRCQAPMAFRHASPRLADVDSASIRALSPRAMLPRRRLFRWRLKGGDYHRTFYHISMTTFYKVHEAGLMPRTLRPVTGVALMLRAAPYHAAADAIDDDEMRFDVCFAGMPAQMGISINIRCSAIAESAIALR